MRDKAEDILERVRVRAARLENEYIGVDSAAGDENNVDGLISTFIEDIVRLLDANPGG